MFQFKIKLISINILLFLIFILQDIINQISWVFVPENLIKIGGLTLLTFIIFAETGLFVGFFLPGDSLLFSAGLLCSIGTFDVSIVSLLLYLNMAAISGNMFGYYFGKKIGSKLFEKDDSWIFKKRYILLTNAFYLKHGGKAIVIGRFLPIIRTFAPILAGIIKLDYKQFMIFTVVGSILWTFIMTLSGFYLVKIFPGISDHLHLLVIFLIIITSIPLIITYNKQKKGNQTNTSIL